MITMTTPEVINTVLGGNVPVNYDKIVLSPINFDPVNQLIAANVRMSSTASPNQQTITGTLTVKTLTSELILEVPQISFYRRMLLNTGQNTAISNQIETAQAQVENGVITLGVVAGTRSGGV
jgi:hypothetical protein